MKWNDIQHATKEELTRIEGVGDVMAEAYVKYFRDPSVQEKLADLLSVLDLDETEEEREEFLSGMTFVITGSLNHYENREALKAEIEGAGGKVAGSVSRKTSYLINNDLASTSGKNRKARELGIPIIDEEEIRRWLAAGAVEETAPEGSGAGEASGEPEKE